MANNIIACRKSFTDTLLELSLIHISVEEGLEDIRQGKVLIVVDDEDRENEGDFIVSGEKITPEIVNFMITHGRGLLCAPLPRSRCEELGLAPMAEENLSLIHIYPMKAACHFPWTL